MPELTRETPPVRNAVMDWDQFKDGKTRVCKVGEDFNGHPDTFQHRARHAAERRGMKATTWTKGDRVYVQFVAVDKPEAKAVRKRK